MSRDGIDQDLTHTIYPSVINFGSVGVKKYYETKFYVVNDDAMIQKIIVKPPLESQNIFVIYPQGNIAPGMKKAIKVQLDTTYLKKGFYKRDLTVTTKYRIYNVAVTAFIDCEENSDMVLDKTVNLKKTGIKIKELTKIKEKLHSEKFQTTVKVYETNPEGLENKSKGLTSFNIPKLSYDPDYNLVLTKQDYTMTDELSSLNQ